MANVMANVLGATSTTEDVLAGVRPARQANSRNRSLGRDRC